MNVAGIPITCPHCGSGVRWADTSDTRGPCRVVHRIDCGCGWQGAIRVELLAIRTPIVPDERARRYRAGKVAA